MLGFGVLVHIAQILALFGAFSGRFSDISWSALEGSRGLFDTAKSSRTWGVATVSLGRFAKVWGLFRAKNGYFSPKTAHIWESTSRPGAPAPGRHR